MEHNSDQSQYSYPESREVRLTRFSSLDNIENQQPSALPEPPEKIKMEQENDNFNQAKEKPIENCLTNLDNFEKNDGNLKWPWSRAVNMDTSADGNNDCGGGSSNQNQQSYNQVVSIKTSQQIVLDPIFLQQAADYRAATDLMRKVGEPGGQKEVFQVIWSQLAFEVNLRTYDQLLGRVLNKAKSILSCSSSSAAAADKKNDKQNQDFMTAQSHQSHHHHLHQQSSIHESKHKRIIFENLNGHIKSGEISAILGPSGVGKSSLINAICSKANANYRGRVQLIGSESSSRKRVSVIPQKDHLADRLTVKENLIFASKILNSDKEFDHEENILRTAKMLNLVSCLESPTGSISGGEYKRVSIAQELLKRPDILILDEPTSGLDSVNCKNLIKSLRSLIDASHLGTINPIAIVMTIHQPDVEIFHMFDHIYCMARGGRTIYEGHPSRALDVIRSHSGIDCDTQTTIQMANVNPANLLVEIASEYVYGSSPIEKLNKYQLKQFEHLNQQHLNNNNFPPNDSRLSQQDKSSSWPSMVNHLVGGTGSDGNSSSSRLQTIVSTSKTTDCLSSAETINAQPRSGSLNSSSFSVHSIPPSSSSSSSSSQSSPSSSMNNAPKSSAIAQHGKKSFIRDRRLNSKVDHKGKFWYHMFLLTKRNFISDIRDPLMTGAAIVFHLMIPFVMWIVYTKRIGTVKACPVIHREMELLALASEETASRLANLQEDFAIALECSTMFFLTSYCFSLRSLSMAALSFPLSMHILVKESRNGWYRVPAYVLAKTVTSLLTEVLLPVLSVIMIYVIMDMPESPYQWRLWAVASVMALVSIIGAVQGLIWGAISMDSIQTAIFMASASSLPMVMLSGFTARIKYMPRILQLLSWISPYRYSSDTINMIRFGFGLCPCDSEMDEYLKTKTPTFNDIPDRMKPLMTFYLTNNENADDDEATTIATANATTTATQLAAQQHITGISYDLVLNSTVRNDMTKRLESNELDLFGRMAELLSKSFTYGREITGCDTVRSELLQTGGVPDDHYLPAYFAGLTIMFILLNILLFAIVKSKVSKHT